jgi:hypothetical protein
MWLASYRCIWHLLSCAPVLIRAHNRAILICRALRRAHRFQKLTPLPLHGNAGGIADPDPNTARTGLIRAIDLLRHDALRAKPAGVREDGTATFRRCVC